MAEQKEEKKLKLVPFGGTGIKVSELCFGGMSIGKSAWGMKTCEKDEDAFALLDTFVAAGGNFIDTANVYGTSEKVIGRWLKYAEKKGTVKRDDLIISSKFSAEGKGANRKNAMFQIKQTLANLQTDYLDVYFVHIFDKDTPLKETLSVLNDLVHAGKVHYLGASNFTAYQLGKAAGIAKEYGYEKFSVLQPQYSLLCRRPEWSLWEAVRDEKLANMTWSSLCGGLLTGKIKRNKKEAEEGGRQDWSKKFKWKHTSVDKHDNDITWNTIELLEKIAAKHKVAPATIALKWVLQKKEVTCPILGTRTQAHLKDALAIIGLELSQEDMDALDNVSEPEPQYPWFLR